MDQKTLKSALTRLLLGRMSEREREKWEARLLVEDESFETLLALDEELLDGYVADELSASDRRKLDRRLRSSPEMAERLEFARALATLGGRHQPSRRGYWALRPWVVAAASLLIVTGGVLYWILRVSTDWQGGPLPGQSTFSIELLAVAVRAEYDRPQTQVPPNVEWIQLRLDTPGGGSYERFRAVLVTEDGWEEIHRGDYVLNDAESGAVVEIWVPARELRPGGYLISLSGIRLGGSPEVIAYYEVEILAGLIQGVPGENTLAPQVLGTSYGRGLQTHAVLQSKELLRTWGDHGGSRM